MRIITYTEARRNLRRELDIVVETNEPTYIKSLKNEVVLIPLCHYLKLNKANAIKTIASVDFSTGAVTFSNGDVLFPKDGVEWAVRSKEQNIKGQL